MKFSEISIEKQERANSTWDKSVISDLMTSNAPPYLIEHHLSLIANTDSNEEFITKSNEYKLI